MITEWNKRIILSLRMESNHAPPAFRADVLTTVLERSVDHSFRSVLCSKGNTSKITGTMDRDRYIEEMLPVTLRCGNDMFGTDWTFLQDSARAHLHVKLQKLYDKHFPCFIDKHHWPSNSPNLSSLDYSIWDELAHQVNWDAVTSKTTLISELKHTVRKVSPDVVFESCSS